MLRIRLGVTKSFLDSVTPFVTLIGWFGASYVLNSGYVTELQNFVTEKFPISDLVLAYFFIRIFIHYISYVMWHIILYFIVVVLSLLLPFSNYINF